MQKVWQWKPAIGRNACSIGIPMQGALWLRELWTIALGSERSTDPVIWWARPAVRASENRGSSHERGLVEAERERGRSRVDLTSTTHQPWRRFERN
jgi:hypothetical protein